MAYFCFKRSFIVLIIGVSLVLSTAIEFAKNLIPYSAIVFRIIGLLTFIVLLCKDTRGNRARVFFSYLTSIMVEFTIDLLLIFDDDWMQWRKMQY